MILTGCTKVDWEGKSSHAEVLGRGKHQIPNTKFQTISHGALHHQQTMKILRLFSRYYQMTKVQSTKRFGIWTLEFVQGLMPGI